MSGISKMGSGQMRTSLIAGREKPRFKYRNTQTKMPSEVMYVSQRSSADTSHFHYLMI